MVSQILTGCPAGWLCKAFNWVATDEEIMEWVWSWAKVWDEVIYHDTYLTPPQRRIMVQGRTYIILEED